jgi:anti-sigma factor RsiW
MMKTHYSEADLLETYYLQPGESMPVMMHLADCSACAAKYERLERKLREAAACTTHERPETFWARQRMSVMRRVASGSRFAAVVRTSRIAAAAALTFFLGGAVVYKSLEPALEPAQAVVISRPAVHEEQTAAHDAWQSEELQEFHGVVDWETWQ